MNRLNLSALKWPDVEEGELTGLQEALKASDMSRDFRLISKLFWRAGINLLEEFDEVVTDSKDEEVVVLDEGCGTGASIEHFWRIANSRKSLRGRTLRTIGLDVNPLPERIPPYIHKGKKIRTEFLAGNAQKLDLPDNSIDFGYSFALLQYCDDPLRVLEEAHRVLKPNGRMIWCLSGFNDISFYPLIENILANTQGGYDNFQFTCGEFGENETPHFAIVCEKNPEVEFKGFPYEVSLTFPKILRTSSVHPFVNNKIHRRTDEIRGDTRKMALLLALGTVLSMMTCDTGNSAPKDADTQTLSQNQ